MPAFRNRISQTTLTWLLTALAFAALLPALLIPTAAQAELRAFRLKITNATTGTERLVTTRFDHIQYGMYHRVSKDEVVIIDQTWMCYQRSDFLNSLCPAPPQSPVPDKSGGPGMQDRRPAAAAPTKR